MMKSKKIEFILGSKDYDGWALSPVPANTNIPSWYKEKSKYTHGDQNPKIMQDGGINLTIKNCTPVLDIITSGYDILLGADVYFETVRTEETVSVVYSTRMEEDILSHHSINQTSPLPIPPGFFENAFKWIANFSIKTPKGYSCIFMTPPYQDLPIFTLPAIVDTDSWTPPVNIPFLLKEDFTGLIERGTPIARVIPFKRDRWSSVVINDQYENIQKSEKLILSKLTRYYKNSSWSKKFFT